MQDLVHSKQNHVPNVDFAVPDCPPNSVSSSRSSQFLCICQMLSKSSGQIYSSHIGSKIVSCFCQIVSLCCWDTYKMCAKICAPESWKIRCFVTHKRIDRDLKSWSKSVFFDWLTGSIEFVIIWHKMLKHLAKCKSDLYLFHFLPWLLLSEIAFEL